MDTDQLIEEICRRFCKDFEGVLRIVVQCLGPERIIRCLLKNSTEDDINVIHRIIMSSRNDYHRGQGSKIATENDCQMEQEEQLGMSFMREEELHKKSKGLEQSNNDLQMQLAVAKDAAVIRTRVLCQTANDTVTHTEKYKFLGRGCFGIVYRMALAVKEPVDPSPERLEEFQREAKLMKMFCHPNIVRCDGYDQESSKIFLELMDGNLQQLLEQEKQRLSDKDRKHLVQGASRGLMELHDKDTIHRDIKPDNIMINKLFFGYERLGVKSNVKVFYEAKIGDLGLAVQYPEREANERQLELERWKKQDVLAFARVMKILFTDPQTGNVQDQEMKSLIHMCERGKLTMKEVYMQLLLCHSCWICASKRVDNDNPFR